MVVAAGDEIYREWGWNMFRAFERWTRRETGGYATVTNVNSVSWRGYVCVCVVLEQVLPHAGSWMLHVPHH